MTLATWLATWKTRWEHQQPPRMGRRSAGRRPASARLRMERLEVRLTPTGFGPQDGAYIVEPWLGYYSAVRIQPTDQKVVAAGSLSNGGGLAVARYDSVGNPDTGYGSGGLSTPPVLGSDGGGLVFQPDGKAVVAAMVRPPSQTGTYFGVARLNTNGSLDSGFGSGGWTSVNVGSHFAQVTTGVGLQSTGRIVVSGYTWDSGSLFTRSAVLARFTTSGAVDSGRGGFGDLIPGNKATGYTTTTFGAPLAEFDAVAVQPNDRVVAVGVYSATGTSADRQLIVARYTAAGRLDTTFNGSGYSVLNLPGISYTSTPYNGRGVALQSDGKIVVASTSAGIDGAGDMLVVRYNSNGTLDTGFGGIGYVRLDIDGTASQTYEAGRSIAIQPDGKIVVAGDQHPIVSGLTSSNVLVARLNPNGTPDATFGNNGFKIGAPPAGPDYHYFRGSGVALQSDGSIIVAGNDHQGGNSSDPSHPLLMRFFGSQPSPILAAGGAATGGKTAHLTTVQLQPIVTAAIDRWAAAGLDAESLHVMRNATVTIANLGNSSLGLAFPSFHGIRIDDDAAGYGWFVDRTPFDDREFARPWDQGEQRRMDLLSVLAHELGHLAGLDHDNHPDDVMGGSLATGTRRLPTQSDVRVALAADDADFEKPTIPASDRRHRPSRRR